MRACGLGARGACLAPRFGKWATVVPPVPPGVWPPSSGETAVGPGLVKRKCEVGPSEGTWAAGRERGAGPALAPTGPPPPSTPHVCSVPRLSSGRSVSRGPPSRTGADQAVPPSALPPACGPTRGRSWVTRSIRPRGHEPRGRADGHLCTGPWERALGWGSGRRLGVLVPASAPRTQDPGQAPSRAG